MDLEEEFRLLTLQIIGEAILSLPPDECDRVFPHLYLPVRRTAALAPGQWGSCRRASSQQAARPQSE